MLVDNNPEKIEEIPGTTFILKLIASLISVFGCKLAISLIRPNDRIILTLVIICS